MKSSMIHSLISLETNFVEEFELRLRVRTGMKLAIFSSSALFLIFMRYMVNYRLPSSKIAKIAFWKAVLGGNRQKKLEKNSEIVKIGQI